jgi:hypothetical protein
VLTGPPLDPDRDQARRLLEEELTRGDYQLQESWVSRAWSWFTDLFSGFSGVGPLPGWVTWVLLVLVLVAVLAVLAFATRDRWRTGRLARRGAPGAVLEGPARAAAEHRQEATAALAAGDHDRALLEAYRATAAGAVERTLLDDRPGRTANELATGLAPVFPDIRQELLAAADAFDAVRYGDHRATPEQARHVVDLDARVHAARPVLAEVAL